MHLLRRYRSLVLYVSVFLVVIIITGSALHSQNRTEISDLRGYLYNQGDDKLNNVVVEKETAEVKEENKESKESNDNDNDTIEKTKSNKELSDKYQEEAEIENYIEKVYNEDPDTFNEDISKLTDEEIAAQLKNIKEKQKNDELLKKQQQSISKISSQGDNVEGTLIDNEDRIRKDITPDNKPWSQYELERIININETNISSYKRQNATLFTLCRNSELYSMLKTIHQVESRFNNKFGYDWVFLNDEPFSKEFINLTSNMISGRVRYGLIPREHWSYPDYIDEDKAKEVRESRKWASITYGTSESYRHMCRFNSMFFYKHPIMREYEYYWRIEPDVNFHCDIMEDPFKFLKNEGIKYGFTISMRELHNTIETLWETSKKYFNSLNKDYFSKEVDNLSEFISDDNGETYNLCHYWSNFEIASLSIYNNEIYEGYVNYLDKAGGFFYERWGDAPIHSIIFSLILRKDEIHLFQDISYEHTVGITCPLKDSFRQNAKCTCNPVTDNWVLTSESSCNIKFIEIGGANKEPEYEEYMRKIQEEQIAKNRLREEQKQLRAETARRQAEARRKKAEERRKARLAKQTANKGV
ncbi:hypothetical protein DAPK24_034180 [Pichia kluyveri]|uniref:Uncharacterized protein n=1 Tax=Pichia kluyveri TaxID=36015 RepID=A0AAV5R7N6_PICKL|nr:hypothetical protein DAPK24_034180 [Pichia kluyveri]